MSLDIYIESATEETDICTCECGHEHEFKYFPRIKSLSITHNLGKMAEAASLYGPVWSPEEIGIDTCHQMINHLKNGLEDLIDHPEKFKKYNSPNGWGTYDNFVDFLRKYLRVCVDNPTAKIRVCR